MDSQRRQRLHRVAGFPLLVALVVAIWRHGFASALSVRLELDQTQCLYAAVTPQSTARGEVRVTIISEKSLNGDMPVSAPRTFGKELRTEVELVVEHVVHTGNQYVVRGLEPLVLLNLSSGEPALFTFVADPVVADAAVQGAGNEWTDYTAPDEFADMRLYEQDLYYRLCVSLQVFRVRRKSGRTRVHAGDAELEGSAIPPRMVSLTLHTSVQGKDYQALAAKSHLGPLEIELQRLQDELKELSVQISVATERAERIRELNERTKRGVMLSSVIACAVLCVAGYLQTAYLRDFIKKAKLS